MLNRYFYLFLLLGGPENPVNARPSFATFNMVVICYKAVNILIFIDIVLNILYEQIHSVIYFLPVTIVQKQEKLSIYL